MRKLLLMFIALTAMTFLSPARSQQNHSGMVDPSNANNPKSVATQYLKAMIGGNVKEMLSYDIDYVQANATQKQEMEEEYGEMLSNFKGAKFKVGAQRTDPEGYYDAIVDAEITLPNGQSMGSPIPFKKVNGKWYIKASS